MKNEKVYSFIPLTKVKEHLKPEPIPQAELDAVKNDYLILKTENENSVFIKATRKHLLFFNEKYQKIGFPLFHISTTLTLESSNTEIKAEIRRYEGAIYKQRCIDNHKYLKPIRKYSHD